MHTQTTFNYRKVLNSGLLAGVITLLISMIGMVELFGKRDLISNLLTMGQVMVYAPAIIFAFNESRKLAQNTWKNVILTGLIIGTTTGLFMIALVMLASAVNIRRFFVNVSPVLIELLTFEMGAGLGGFLLFLSLVVAGLAGAIYNRIPERVRLPLLYALGWTLVLGLLSEILSERVRRFFGFGVERLIFSQKALQPAVALILFLSIAGIYDQWSRRKHLLQARLVTFTPKQKKNARFTQIGLGIVVALILPLLLGTYLSEVVNNVGLFILMGLGLNIVVGFAGLLDLGYVAFFAIGAYMMGILTSTGSLGIAQMSFWAALPFCVLASTMAGVMLGIPVLRMRGDYLAIVTLGFGEIIRVLANSDLLKSYIGGAQGILQIPKPAIGDFSLVRPEALYYVILGGVIIAAFISFRLRDSRLGRQWMAMREDEDVAEAMGINLVSTKLLAFAIGAAFSGFSGAIFAAKLTSIFPHSFNLLISINTLSLIIVGGMGSLPGVMVGSLILVGLPELLREFAEYRLLMYGMLLIVMMLMKPEGFWPSEAIRREMHAHEEDNPTESLQTGAMGSAGD